MLENVQITIDVTKHVQKVGEMMCELFEMDAKSIDVEKIKQFIIADINWWLNESEDNEKWLLHDSIINWGAKTHEKQ